ncbi:MAG: hypothetical protein EZS28_051317, partial [Streblomastix strix]
CRNGLSFAFKTLTNSIFSNCTSLLIYSYLAWARAGNQLRRLMVQLDGYHQIILVMPIITNYPKVKHCKHQEHYQFLQIPKMMMKTLLLRCRNMSAANIIGLGNYLVLKQMKQQSVRKRQHRYFYSTHFNFLISTQQCRAFTDYQQILLMFSHQQINLMKIQSCTFSEIQTQTSSQMQSNYSSAKHLLHSLKSRAWIFSQKKQPEKKKKLPFQIQNGKNHFEQSTNALLRNQQKRGLTHQQYSCSI